MNHSLKPSTLAIVLLVLLMLAAAPLQPAADPKVPSVRRGHFSPPPTDMPTTEPRLTLDELLKRHPGLRAVLCKEPTYNVREGEFLLPIFMYHQFNGSSYLSVKKEAFEEQLALLRALNYTSLTFSELSEVLSGTLKLPSRPVALTFDDGWKTQYKIAYPLMRRYEMHGTFFVLAHRTRGGGEMDLEALKDLVAHGMEIGSHSYTHAKFDETITPGRLWNEVKGSREMLQEQLGVPVVSFAYPYGLSQGGALGAVSQSGYEIAAGTGGNIVQNVKRRYYMYRVEIRGQTSLVEFARWLPWRAPELCAPRPSIPKPLPSPRIRAK